MATTLIMGRHRTAPSHHFVDPPTPGDGEVIPAGYIPFFGGMFGADFQVQARIYSSTVRYKQYVKGSFTYNNVAQPHQLHGSNLHPTNYVEDGNTNGVYGVRGQSIPGLSTYQHVVDLQGRPCDLFSASDTPSDSLQCLAQTVIRIDLSFLGQIVDVGYPYFVYAERRWQVVGTHTKT